ncbi:hypothetical protein [Chondrinema litorale]|uniref:hypothetical protein n=1 Tax=Chondrinema litorale TaxID=2994555 RepID=UPI0025433AA6|nr:hypothetical protein [Chondrinema litorale]UZS00201.1 hypothetical protein OQ292_40485 [Chondrinema litorale]
MACRSASLERAVKRSQEALEVIRRLDADMQKVTQEEITEFDNLIKDYADINGVNDFSFNSLSTEVKVSYTHEFNIDALIPIIKGLLNTAAIALGANKALEVFAKPENIKIFTDLFNGIAQALKTTSTTGTAFSFNANNIAPGFRVFTSIKTRTIQDKETFGKEAITAQTILYKMGLSPTLIVEDVEIGLLLSLNAIVKYLADARVGLALQVKEGTLSVGEYLKLTKDISTSIRYHEEEIAKRTKSDSLEDARNKSFESLTKSTKTEVIIEGVYTNDEAIEHLKKAIDFFQEQSDLYLPILNDVKQLIYDFQAGTYVNYNN